MNIKPLRPHEFLQDLIRSLKTKNSKAFSYRALAKRAGLKSPATLHAYIKGDRTIELKVISNLKRALNITQHETDKLIALTLYYNLDESSKLKEKMSFFLNDEQTTYS
jgi:hypothetical protein